MMMVRSQHATTPTLIKSVLRLCRRARERGLWDFDVPPNHIDVTKACQVRIHNRVLLVHPDGDIVQSLRFTTHRGRTVFDPHALLAHRNRWHATWLKLAADSRRNRMYRAARLDLTLAAQDRVHP